MTSHSDGPGAIRCAPGTHVLNADRTPDERRTVVITNTGDRPVQVGSHVHLPLVNAAEGFRLDVPSGTSQRFEPGASRSVAIVALRGRRVVPGIQVRADG
jgi:urease subunit beta